MDNAKDEIAVAKDYPSTGEALKAIPPKWAPTLVVNEHTGARRSSAQST
jgi:hypothetical protein